MTTPPTSDNKKHVHMHFLHFPLGSGAAWLVTAGLVMAVGQWVLMSMNSSGTRPTVGETGSTTREPLCDGFTSALFTDSPVVAALNSLLQDTVWSYWIVLVHAMLPVSLTLNVCLSWKLAMVRKRAVIMMTTATSIICRTPAACNRNDPRKMKKVHKM